jgi:hypothetical protein
MVDRFEIVGSASSRPEAERIIFCDGSGGKLFQSETDLELSHWRPSKTPAEYRAGTSTEICFRFLDNLQPGPWTVAVNNHVGVDAMVRRGSWTLSGEAIYDQYGLRRPGTALNDITWGRSLYYRDLNNAYHVPITGVGYYMNLGYEGPQWSLMLNYGEFYPQQIGDARQDVTTRRGLIKASRHWTRHFETYGIALLENDLHNAFDSSTRRGTYFIIGGQFAW